MTSISAKMNKCLFWSIAILMLSSCGGFQSALNSGVPPISFESDLAPDSLLVASEESIVTPQGGFVRNHLHYSNDLGETWQELPRPDDEFHRGFIRMLKFSEGFIAIGTERGFALGESLGRTWQTYGRDQSGYGTLSQTTYDILLSPQVILAATGDGLNISTDQGNSWQNQRLTQWTSAPSSTAVQLELLEDRIFMASLYGVLVSTNQGISWQPVPYSNNPSNPQQGNPRLLITQSALWINDLHSGLHRSTDGGQTWQSITLPDLTPYREFVLGVEGSDTHLLAWNTLGLYATTDQGLTWQWTSSEDLTGPDQSQIVSLSFRGETALLLTQKPQRLLISRDQGETWRDISGNLGFPVDQVRKVLVPDYESI